MVSHAASPGGIELTTGEHGALLVRVPGHASERAGDLAARIRTRPGEVVAVLDLPSGPGPQDWEAVAQALGRGRAPLRLITEIPVPIATLGASWLCERLRRVVVVAGSEPVVGPGGWTFAGSDPGWIRFRPGRGPVAESPRYPRPSWDGDLAAVPTVPLSVRSACEPLPSGLWIRPQKDSAASAIVRKQLILTLPPRETVTIVVGLPGGLPVYLDDVLRVRNALPPHLRSESRLAQLGPVLLPPGRTLGQALAELTGEDVLAFNGAPVTDPARRLMVRTMDDEGSWNIWPFATELRYRAGRTGPEVLTHRPPLTGLSEIRPGTYRKGQDTLVEVVQAGLLLRRLDQSVHTAGVRATAADLVHHNVVIDTGGGEALRSLARMLLDDLDDRARAGVRVTSAAEFLEVPTVLLRETAGSSPDGTENAQPALDEIAVAALRME